MQLVASSRSTSEKSEVAHSRKARELELTSRFSHIISEGCGAIFTCLHIYIQIQIYIHINAQGARTRAHFEIYTNTNVRRYKCTGRANSSSFRDSRT